MPRASTAQSENAEAQKAQVPGGVYAFAGYSFVETDYGIEGLDAYGTNGFHLELSRFFSPKFGVAAELSGLYGTTSSDSQGITDLSSNQYTFLVGPRLNSRSFWKFSFSSRALIGISSLELDADQSGGDEFQDGRESSFAIALGASIDLALTEQISLRLIQTNRFFTYFGDGLQSNNRYSTGIVVHF